MLAALLVAADGARAEIVLIVSEESTLTAATRRQLIDLYLGRSRTLTTGHYAVPIDFHSGNPLRQRFYTDLTGKGEAQVDAYWARLVFSGHMTPLRQVRDEQEMLRAVLEDPAAIGYLERVALPAGIQVVTLEGAP